MTREFRSQPSSEKNTVDQLLHRVQTEETNKKSVFLQPDHVPSKHELPLPYTTAVLTIVWPFIRTFSKPSSPELRNFSRHIPGDLHLNAAALETHAAQK